MEEAKTISESVLEHFRHRPEETLDVVAMNSEQRLQIECAIKTLAKGDAVFQGWLDKDSARRESLFIKGRACNNIPILHLSFSPSSPKALTVT